MDKPAFEVFYIDEESRNKTKSYKVYENGTIEGFPPGALIINRIPCLTDVTAGDFSRRVNARCCDHS